MFFCCLLPREVDFNLVVIIQRVCLLLVIYIYGIKEKEYNFRKSILCLQKFKILLARFCLTGIRFIKCFFKSL